MSINYYRYHELTEKLFYGVPLTDEHLNEAHEQIAKYLADGGAKPITDALGLVFIERVYGDGKLITRRICYKVSGRELTPVEIGNIGLFLPYGSHYGSMGVPTI